MSRLRFVSVRPNGWTIAGASAAQQRAFTDIDAVRRRDFGLALEILHSVNHTTEVDEAGVCARIALLQGHDELLARRERDLLSELLTLFSKAGDLSLLQAATGTWNANGTRYELVFTEEPNGGVLVSWPAGKWMGRAHYEQGTQIRLVSLAGKLLRGDEKAIVDILNMQRDPLSKWGL